MRSAIVSITNSNKVIISKNQTKDKGAWPGTISAYEQRDALNVSTQLSFRGKIGRFTWKLEIKQTERSISWRTKLKNFKYHESFVRLKLR